jgi:general secretion pathway protein M
MTLPALQPLKDAWDKLGGRERVIVSAVAIAATVLILYLFLLLPVQRDLARLRAQLPREAEQLQWMRAQAPLAQQLRGRSQTTAAANLPGTLEQTASTAGFKPQVSTTDAGRNIQISIDAVAFNALAAWLADLQQTHGVVIDDAAIDALPTSGTVSARIRLRAGGQ